MELFDTNSDDDLDVPSDERTWQSFAAENRARIRTAEAELIRLRDRQHQLSEQLGIVAALAVEVRNIADDVRELSAATKDLVAKTSETVTRPTASVIAQYLAVLIALVAVAISLTR